MKDKFNNIESIIKTHVAVKIQCHIISKIYFRLSFENRQLRSRPQFIFIDATSKNDALFRVKRVFSLHRILIGSIL